MATSEEGEVSSKPRVSIRSLSGRTCHFDVKEDTTVEQLKHIIEGDMEVSVERQRLLFQGKILLDSQLLKDAGCFNKVIHLIKRAEPPTNPPTLPTSSAPDTPSVPVSGTTASVPVPGTGGPGVVIGRFPFIAPQQIFNNIWTMAPTPTSSAPTNPATSTPPTQPAQGAGPNRAAAVPGVLWEVRHLLQFCGNVLDRFDRGESINIQDSSLPPPGAPPSISVGSSMLGDLYRMMVSVYERLVPLFREEAQFLQEDLELGEGDRVRLERVAECVRAVLERLHVCEVHLMNVSVSCSQAPPRTVQSVIRNHRRRVVIQAPPHMAHVQVNINTQQSHAHPPASAPSSGQNTTAPTSNPGEGTPVPSGQAPPVPNPAQVPQPIVAPSPAELTNIFVQAINSVFPTGVNPPASGSTQTSAVPHTISGEAVIIQNGVVNSIPFGSGAVPTPLLPGGVPQGLSIIQLARSLYPGFVDDPGEDLFSRLILVLCSELTVEQLREVVQGRVECLQSLYPRIREFVLRDLVREGSKSGEEERNRAGRVIAESATSDIEGLLEALPAQEGLDMKETFVAFLQSHFKTAIMLVLDPRNEDIETSNTDNRFGKVIWGWGHNMLCELCQLVDVLAAAGGTDIHSVLEAFLRIFMQENEGAGDIPVDIIQVMLRDNREKINSMKRSSRLTEQQIKDKYFIKSTPEPILTEKPELLPVCDWVPQEWKECIQEDTQVQTSNQTCFSNSYMTFSGLTDNKDHKVECTAEDMLCDTLKMSMNSSQVKPNSSVDEVMHDVRQNSSLKKRYNEFIDSNLNKRIRSDPNHTAERFPSSAARFKPDES